MLIAKEPTAADSEGIKAIYLESRLENFMQTLPPGLIQMAKGLGMKNIMNGMAGFDHDELLAGCVDDFLDERNRCILLEEDFKTIGYCIASYEIVNDFGRIKHLIGIGDIFIKKECRRKGLGSKLLKAFVDEMNKKEICSIITVLKEKQYTPANVKLFEKNGFVLEKLSYNLNLTKKKYKVDHTIRKAVPGDYEGYAKLITAMYESFLDFDKNIYHGTDVVFSQGYYLEELREPNCLHTVCEIDNEIAGICMITVEEDSVFIHSVSVADKYARQGVATSLYHNAFNFAKEQGYSEIKAVVFAQNETSCGFHEHMMMRPESHRYIYKTI